MNLEHFRIWINNFKVKNLNLISAAGDGYATHESTPKGTFKKKINKINMKQQRRNVMNDKIFEILRRWKFRVFFLFWRFFFVLTVFQLLRTPRCGSLCKELRETKKFWLKESVIRRVMSKAFEHLIETSRTEVFLFILFFIVGFSISRETLFISVVMLYVFIRSFKTRQLVLTCAANDACSDLKNNYLWYIVALIMKWDAALDAILILKKGSGWKKKTKSFFFRKII